MHAVPAHTDRHLWARLNVHQRLITILPLMLLSDWFSPSRLDFTAQRWRWYVALHCKHTVSWPLLICTQREMPHVQARCGCSCCGCTVVVSGSHLKTSSSNWRKYEWINSPLSWQTLRWLEAQMMTKSCRTSTFHKPQTNAVVHSQIWVLGIVVQCCVILQVQLFY